MTKHSFLGLAAMCTAATLLVQSADAQINLTAGDVAIIGWIDNGTPNDTFTIVTLADIPAGSLIYFTDNGWTGTAFRNTTLDGDGNEQLLEFNAVNLIPAGTIISTTDTSANFTWVTGVVIPGATGTANFNFPALAQAGDQVYVFQQDTGLDPLNTGVQQHLFVLDDTGTFEAATTSNTGDIPPGLSLAAGTAITWPQNSSGQDFMAFNTTALASGTKTDWLTAIANVANWTFGTAGTLPSGTIAVNSANSGTAYCFGDGSGTACPCANLSTVGNNEGCLNSLGTGGKLVGTGSPSLAADTLVLHGSQMPSSSVLYFQGTTMIAAGNGAGFGDGLRCAGGSIIRLKTTTNVAGASQFPGGGDPSVSTKGLVTVAGTRNYQAWYRNAAAFCTPSTFNVTNGWSVIWVP